MISLSDELAELDRLEAQESQRRCLRCSRLRALRAATGLDSLLLHYPPYYGESNLLKSLRLFAEAVIPAFRTPAGSTEAAE